MGIYLVTVQDDIGIGHCILFADLDQDPGLTPTYTGQVQVQVDTSDQVTQHSLHSNIHITSVKLQV